MALGVSPVIMSNVARFKDEITRYSEVDGGRGCPWHQYHVAEAPSRYHRFRNDAYLGRRLAMTRR